MLFETALLVPLGLLLRAYEPMRRLNRACAEQSRTSASALTVWGCELRLNAAILDCEGLS